MKYQARDFTRLIGMEGFSKELLTTHFKLYEGYVANFNKLQEITAEMLKGGKTTSPEYAEIKRRMGWEFNGIRLHEYYFSNLGGKDQIDKNSPLSQDISKVFGSFDKWREDFKSTGSMRGIGWVVLYRDNFSGGLFNCWINEHDAGHLAGASPLLILDVFEHAFIMDYGTNKASYLESFFRNIDWSEVTRRFEIGKKFQPSAQEISVA
jgi:Fe-Mn family superoxide dismutase